MRQGQPSIGGLLKVGNVCATLPAVSGQAKAR